MHIIRNSDCIPSKNESQKSLPIDPACPVRPAVRLPARPPARPPVRPQEEAISLYILQPPDRPHLMRQLVIN